MRAGSIFFASDKAVFDALNQHKFTKANLQSVFLRRGILTSNETDREELARHYSRMMHDYHDNQFIAKIFGQQHRREKTTLTQLNNDISNDAMEKIVDELCNELTKFEDIAEPDAVANGFKIKATYKTVDYNKTEFRQVVEKEAEVVIEKENDKWSIRCPLNPYIDDLKDKFLNIVEESIKAEVDLDLIELKAIESPELRTKFFLILINSIDGYEKYDVSDVYVFHPQDEADSSATDTSLGVHISKASLKGEGVLESEEHNSLLSKGFYIWKIIWKVKGSESESDLYELEAQFAKPETCERFSFLVRGFCRYQGIEMYSKSVTRLPKSEETRFSKLLDSAARKSIIEIQNQ